MLPREMTTTTYRSRPQSPGTAITRHYALPIVREIQRVTPHAMNGSADRRSPNRLAPGARRRPSSLPGDAR